MNTDAGEAARAEPSRGGGGSDATFGVVIADNDNNVRQALADLIRDHPRLHLVGEATDGLEAAALCAQHVVHVALVDVRMPHGGADAVTAIKAANPHTIVAGYTTLTDRRTRERLLEAGAAAVFAKGGGLDIGDEIVHLAAT
ncbi:response regulator transcription factor [Ilumatobacter sp.]|jgi:DNA-binding NarL/FixJ family response regulator|uniref:response regulator transcription factor n=1 Tax=Ilumatobacter sp. TaxID=1967498 RepID=UPI00375253F7